MKLDSPLFDRIRVKRKQNQPQPDRPVCNWRGCSQAATYRAPKGRLREGQYWEFCLDHVREYNHSYNFFAGMSDDAVANYQKESITGHRPTWKMGLNGTQAKRKRPDPNDFYSEFSGAADPFNMRGEFAGAARGDGNAKVRETRQIRNAERKALHALDLEIDAKAEDIKARFKVLVKRHHPDANGGDRSSEDRLVEVIQAYNYLKSSGLC